MHNSVRLQAAAAARAQYPQVTRQNAAQIAAASQRLGGNIGRSGDAALYRYVQDGTPYMNVGMQVAAAHYEALKRNPFEYALTMSTMTMAGLSVVYSQMSEDAELSKKYWDEWTPEQRAARLPIWDADGNEAMSVPIEHMIRPFWSPIIETLGTLTGAKSHYATDLSNVGLVPDALSGHEMATNIFAFREEFGESDWGELRSGLISALSTAQPFSLPIPVEAATGALGIDADFGRFGPNDNMFRQVSTETLTPDSTSKTPHGIPVEAELILNAVLGAQSRALIAGYEGAAAHLNHDLRDDAELRASRAFANRFLAPHYETLPISLTPNMSETQFDTALTGPIAKRLSSSTYTSDQVFSKMKALDLLDQHIAHSAGVGHQSTGLTRRSTRLDPTLANPTSPLQAGTGLAMVASHREVFKYLRTHQDDINRLKIELHQIRATPQFAGNPQALRDRENQITGDIRVEHLKMLNVIRSVEDLISQDLGVPFEFDDDRFTPDKLREFTLQSQP